MILGLGTDLVENCRIKEAYEKFSEKFLHRIYTEEERAYCLSKEDPVPFLAARFAAKEAFIKALNLAGGEVVPFNTIAVAGRSKGKKEMAFSGVALEKLSSLGKCRVHLSMSHGRDHSTATVIIDGI